MRESFKKKYPFIDVNSGARLVGENQRFLLELKAGIVKNWDVEPGLH